MIQFNFTSKNREIDKPLLIQKYTVKYGESPGFIACKRRVQKFRSYPIKKKQPRNLTDEKVQQLIQLGEQRRNKGPASFVRINGELMKRAVARTTTSVQDQRLCKKLSLKKAKQDRITSMLLSSKTC
eukprot:UN32549